MSENIEPDQNAVKTDSNSAKNDLKQPINGHVTKSYNTIRSVNPDQASTNSDDSSGDDRVSRCCHADSCCWQRTGSVAGRLYRVRRSTARLIVLGIFLVFYLVVGSVIFVALEDPMERELRTQLTTSRTNFLAQHICISGLILLRHLTVA